MFMKHPTTTHIYGEEDTTSACNAGGGFESQSVISVCLFCYSL